MVAAEGAAAGTACVVTDRCGVAEFLGGRGAVVIPYDERALEEALAGLLRDDALRAALGRGGREVALELSWANVARLQAQLYERVT
jgi:glycosyltransferase involved in cell wall biosynthesis